MKMSGWKLPLAIVTEDDKESWRRHIRGGQIRAAAKSVNEPGARHCRLGYPAEVVSLRATRSVCIMAQSDEPFGPE
jgi:hypothetical protein